MLRLLLLLSLLLVLTACRRFQPAEEIPTPASIDAMATGVVLTQNAPPPPYNVSISLPSIDDRLLDLAGWRYEVLLEFSGVFARTTRPASARASAAVQFNQLASARRVVVETVGELIGQTEDAAYEAVQLGPDAFLVRQGTCQNNTEAAQLAASLRAGSLIGGIQTAVPAGRQAVLNGEPVFSYAVSQDALLLPAIRAGDGGSVRLVSGELWFSAEHNAAIRFYLNLEVSNAFIFDRQLPVDGSVIIRYDLYDIGTPFNVSVPFGC